MIGTYRVRACLWWIVAAASISGAPAAWAQSAVGTGPLTSRLPDTEPTTNAITLGQVKVAPGIVVHEIGTDSNIFDESVNPKDDFVMSITPDVSAYSRLPYARISAYGALDLRYFHEHTQERSVGHQVRGRVDFLLSRIRPFIGLGQTDGRERPNGEIDVRADRRDDEISGGLAYDLGPHQVIYGAAHRFDVAYRNAIEEGIPLDESLNRRSSEYSAGIRTDLTPLLSLTLSGSHRDDQFETETIRDATQRMFSAVLRFDPEAVVAGSLNVGYFDFNPVDPLIEPYEGLQGSMALSVRLLEFGRLIATGRRGLEYSFDPAEAYYLESTLMLAYTQLLFAGTDLQITGTRSLFDYDAHALTPAHRDTLSSWGASFGYNLPNRTRISLNYEDAQRRSPALAERNYDRQRVFLAWKLGY